MNVFKRLSIVIVLICTQISLLQSQTFNEIKADTLKTALLIVDIQDCYFEGGSTPLVGSVEASLQAKQLLEKFREANLPVVHIMHNANCDIHKNVAPMEGEKVITKNYVNSFRETDLREYLTLKSIDRLVIVGMQTHLCLEGATRAAADFGYKVVVVHDACATRDLTFNEQTVAAAQVHLSTLSTLKSYAKVVSLKEFLK